MAPLGTFAGGLILAAGRPPLYPPRFSMPEARVGLSVFSGIGLLLVLLFIDNF